MVFKFFLLWTSMSTRFSKKDIFYGISKVTVINKLVRKD